MSFIRHRSAAKDRRSEDSFIMSDSGDEDNYVFNKNKTVANPQVIGDSENEDTQEDGSNAANDSETMDSEEEDLEFMNASHKVSIVVNSSDSDSESNEEQSKTKSNILNKLKRRSIYDNPARRTPKNESTPIIRKKAKLNVISSDSEDLTEEGIEEPKEKIKNRALQYVEDDTDDDDDDNHRKLKNQSRENKSTNSMLTSDISSHYQESNVSSNGKNEMKSQNSYSDNFDNKLEDGIEASKSRDESESSYHQTSYKNESVSSDADLQILKPPSVTEKAPMKKGVIDLTMYDDDDPSHNNSSKCRSSNIGVKKEKERYNESYNKSNTKLDKDDDDIIECISSSTSESELDKDVVIFAKKEIGVGNIDPIEAQKKEFLLLKIEDTKKQLDKLNKFAASVDVNKLPDQGEKVHETIKQLQDKYNSFQTQLTKLNNNNKTIQMPKIKKESELHKVVTKSSNNFSSDSDYDYDYDEDVKQNFEVEPKKDPDYNKFDDFDIRDIPNVPQKAFDTAELGKKAMATFSKQQSLTHQRLEQLHSSLTTRPTENELAEDPEGMKTPLMPHQKYALSWMKWREKQNPKGGILADDMGLGKTLTMISLILDTVNDSRKDSEDEDSSDGEWYSKNKHKRYYGGTLVVCPASLMKQWEAEVKNRVRRGLLSVIIFHGNNRTLDDRKLSKANIVITTYQTLVREANLQTGMYRMEWKRVILDEAHYIRNHKSKACLAACDVNAKYRWALSGTPIQNKEMDLYAILKFLKCSPFHELHVWKMWVENKSMAGKQRLVTLMKGLMLRRTKQELQSKGALESLPEKCIEIIEIQMDYDENLAYQKILLFSQNLFAQFLSQRAEKNHMRELGAGKFDKPSYMSNASNTQFTKAQKVLLAHHQVEAHEILVLLLRLRQMCCHPALLHKMLDANDAEVSGLDEDDANAELLNKLHNMSINKEDDAKVEEHIASYEIDERVASNLLTKKNPVFDDDRRSSKVREVIKTIEKIIDKGDKVIVVSQWTSFLKVIAKNLDDIEDASYAMFTGEIAIKKRQPIVDQFNNPRDDLNILLLSLTAGGVGLNLVGANHLLLVDIHWNPQLEAQAQDRIYRFGQKKNVYVYKFLCKDTIEERVKNLQIKKLELANHVLTGTKMVSSKLTMDDIKLLFS